MRTVLRKALEAEGHAVEELAGGPPCLTRLARGEPCPDLVITDLKMQPMDGLTLLREIQARDHRVTTLMMTAHGSIQSAVEAMRLGAFDYLLKPFTLDEIRRVVAAALETHHRRQREVHLPRALIHARRFDQLIGGSAPMQRVYEAIERVAPTTATVLITGETGTGKELVARAIHNLSPRAAGPFVAVNCAALAPSLLESELFGHEKGAFTGATHTHVGRFELADGGTIFLDEVSEVDPKLQAKLLRVLQEHTVERVGGIRALRVDVRVLAAANVDLKRSCAEGTFREDLYYRLNVFPIALPPLRERVDDIAPLSAHFIDRHRAALGGRVAGISEAALAILCARRWEGNVRELENTIQRAIIVARGQLIEPGDLGAGEEARAVGEPAGAASGGTLRKAADLAAQGAERRVLEEALAAEGWNVTHTARRLGISRTTLQERMKRYGLRKPD
jgi:DNA-binding NtrC family response regulator